MKLGKKDRRRLLAALDKVRRGQSYLTNSKTHVCRELGLGSTDVFTRQLDDVKLISVDKYVGSELALLHTGVSELEQLLAEGINEN